MSWTVSSAKRKRSPERDADSENQNIFCIQAREAQIVQNPALAAALEAHDHASASGSQKQQNGLMKWQAGYAGEAWVDRFDALLLLDSLPSRLETSHPTATPSSIGWDDLPTDAEDLFFLNPEEAADFRREAKRRLITYEREARLRALAAAEGDAPETWLSDEEACTLTAPPDEVQRRLMKRTAGHIRESPNPTQLEIRILANLGADPRFSFLRGRWKHSWERIKADDRVAASKTRADGLPAKPSLGLVGYGASDSEEEKTEEVVDGQPEADKVKAERRARAREWSRRRKEGKVGPVGGPG